MNIKRDRTLSAIQKEFNKKFKGLRIAFYKKRHKEYEGSKKDLEYPMGLKVSDIQKEIREGTIDLSPSKTVAQIEHEFEDNFGLHVQVFRRSNTIWLQTGKTDDWTLETQNSKGLRSIQAKEN